MAMKKKGYRAGGRVRRMSKGGAAGGKVKKMRGGGEAMKSKGKAAGGKKSLAKAKAVLPAGYKIVKK